MTNTYNIKGFSCSSCKSTIETTLTKHPDISSVIVNIENKTLSFKTNKNFLIEDLQKLLPEKYTLAPYTSSLDKETVSENQTKLKQLYPLFLIFGYIVFGTFFLNRVNLEFKEVMLDFMGLFYIVFSFFKFLDYKGFPSSFKRYDPLAKVVPVYGYIYPFLELALGIFFLMRVFIFPSLIITIIILDITTIGVVKSLVSKREIRCACLGTSLKLPMTLATLIENSIMIFMALWMLLKHF